jgi:tight adherence protein C
VTIPTENIAIVISASAFLSILLLSMGILLYVRQRAKKIEMVERIRQGEEGGKMLDTHGAPSSSSTGGRILSSLGAFGKRLNPEKSVDYSQIRVKFLRAGLRRRDLIYTFWGTRFFLGILLPASFLVLRVTVFQLISYHSTVAIIMLLALLGFYLPEIWLRVMISRRKEEISRGFADLLDLLVVCVEAGMGLDAAMNRVGQEMKWSNKAWNDELNVYNLELRAGKSRRDALRNLAIRTDIEDVNSFATTLIQTDKFGTSLAQALRVYSDAFRTKRYQIAEEMAAKLPVKLVFPAILCIFPSLFVTLAGPAAIRVYQVIINP